jgi:predicted TIM-barrel fold metal-dependent hydrolase
VSSLTLIDTHVHFWDHSRTDVRWEWLEPGWMDPVIGNIDAIRAPRYRAEEFLEEVGAIDVPKVVHVQAAVDTPDPVAETAWLEETARRTGYPHAIIAHTNLKLDSVPSELERHAAASPRLRGIRDFSDGDYFVDPAFNRGFALLERYALLSEIHATWSEMPKLRDLARAHPGVTIVLEHALSPPVPGEGDFAQWARGIEIAAEAENVHCKLAGHAATGSTWTVDSMRPWMLHCLETFGVARCVLGTDWPVARLSSDYATVVTAYAEIALALPPDDRRALFVTNAEALYRV